MKSSIDFTIEQMTKLFEKLIKNIDTMSLADFKEEKQNISEMAHGLLKAEITQAFLTGTEADLDDTAEEYYYQNFEI